MEASLQLIEWWAKNGRDFPWRRENDPYRILVAEFLLHRTRAQSVVPVYNSFIGVFSSVRDAAEAGEDDIYRILKPLGLNWRVNKIIESFRVIQKDFNGNIPMEKDVLMKLPGIGDYISSALRTFYGGHSDPLIDTNTVRVLCRLRAKQVNDSIRKGKNIRRDYSEFLGNSDPRKFGYALIDLASQVCRPTRPLCRICPLVNHCNTGRLTNLR